MGILNILFPPIHIQIISMLMDCENMQEADEDFIPYLCRRLGIEPARDPGPDYSEMRKGSDGVERPVRFAQSIRMEEMAEEQFPGMGYEEEQNLKAAMRSLGLKRTPPTEESFDKMRRRLMFENHPDRGGSESRTKEILSACETVKAFMIRDGRIDL